MPEIINELGLPQAERFDLFGERYYRESAKGARYPSVTTVLKKTMGPDLTDWYARRAAHRTLDCIEAKPLSTVFAERKQEVRDIIDDASRDAERQALFHAAVGDVFHEFMWTGDIDPVLVEPLPQEFRKMIDRLAYNWQSILQRWHIYPVLAELPMTNDLFEYGGTLDALVEDAKGTRIMLEVKTGRQLELTHAVQAGAYARCLDRMNVRVDEVAVLRVDKYRDDVFDYRLVDRNKAFYKFLSALSTYRTSEEVWEEFGGPNGYTRGERSRTSVEQSPDISGGP